MERSTLFFKLDAAVSKLNVPVLPNSFLPRPRLQDRFKPASPYKLTLVSAPAGYGKTVFLSEVLSLQTRPVAWLSLDRYDNSPARFLTNVAASLQKIDEKLCENALSLLFSGKSLTTVITAFINEISQKVPNVIFAFDDYQVIDNQDIHNSLEYLVDYLPNQCHVIISTRSEPPLPLTKWRGRGYLVEIKGSDLKFTPEEATSLLNTMGVYLSAQEERALYEQTDGWIMGLKMAALLIKSGGDVNDVNHEMHNRGESNREILDYLAKEVLEKQRKHIKQFLLDISIVEQFNAGLCDAITKRKDSAAIIDHLIRSNLFVQVQLSDHHGSSYTLHPLFRNLLRNQLQLSLPGRLRFLHKRASKWYESNGFLESAIEHALMAEEFKKATDLMQQIALNMIGQGKYILFKEWVDRLPEQIVKRNLEICIASAILADAARRIDDEKRYREYVETLITENFNSQPVSSSMNIGGLVATVMALGAYYKNCFDDAISIALEAMRSISEREGAARCTLCAILGAAYWVKGNLQMSFTYWNECAVLAKKLEYNFIYKVATAAKAHIYFHKGYLRAAEDVCLEALELVQSGAIGTGKGVEYLYLLLGQIYYQKNMLCESEKYTKMAIESAEKHGEPVIRLNAHLGIARINLAKAQIEEAMANIRKARVCVYDCDSKYLATYGAFVTLFHLRLGNIREALDYAGSWVNIDINELNTLSSDIRDIWCENPLTVILRIYLARNELERVISESDRVCNVLQQKQFILSALECQLIKCIALRKLNKVDEAINTLLEAIRAVGSEEFLRLFMDEGTAVLELLTMTICKRKQSEHLGTLMRIFRSFGQSLRPEMHDSEGFARQSSNYNLSKSSLQLLSTREYEILDLLQSGFTNKMISEKLMISIPTVKTHLFYLYKKLGVDNRVQAISRARELGIL